MAEAEEDSAADALRWQVTPPYSAVSAFLAADASSRFRPYF